MVTTTMATMTADANYKENKDDNNIRNIYNQRKSTVWLLMLVIGCVIFGFVTSYNNLNDYKSSAYSSASQPRSLLLNKQEPQPQPLLQLSELTRSHIQNIICPEPLFPLYDKIINYSKEQHQQEQLIPRSIHFAWIRGYHFTDDKMGLSRCISQDMMEIVDKWKEQFPSYNVYFHDDVAVDALFYDNGNYWYSIFPQLKEIMNSCVKFGSAMRIDIWRVLILYRYGGFYSDFDIAPGPKLTELTIQHNDSALFLSDNWNRPSQWLMGMEPSHPIMYHTMLIILEQLLKLKNVSKVKLVFLTGPDALKQGYNAVITTKDDGEEPYKQIFKTGIHRLRKPYPNKAIHKLGYKGHVYQNANQKVPYTTNSNNNNTTTIMISKKERIQKEMNTTHWKKNLASNKEKVPSGRCTDHLYMNAQKQQQQYVTIGLTQ